MKAGTRPLAWLATLAMLCCLAGAHPARAALPAPSLQFQQFALTTLPQDAIAWDGSAFIYGGENTRTLMTSDADGQGVKPFIKLPANHGEIRCVASPGAHGFPANTVFCAISNGDIFRIGAHDTAPALFAHLPTTKATDGALAFDTVGAFGYALVAASGGSDTDWHL
jgi:hypothetical protein